MPLDDGVVLEPIDWRFAVPSRDGDGSIKNQRTDILLCRPKMATIVLETQHTGVLLCRRIVVAVAG